MARPTRPGRAVIAAAAALAALAVGAGPLVGTAAANTGSTGTAGTAGAGKAAYAAPPEAVFPRAGAVDSDPLGVETAGRTGVVLREPLSAGYLWQSTNGSFVRDLGKLDTPHFVPGPDGGELVASQVGYRFVRLYNPLSDTATTVPVSADPAAFLRSLVVTPHGWLALYEVPVRNADGQITGTDVHLADPLAPGGPVDRLVVTADDLVFERPTATGVAIAYRVGAQWYAGFVDAATQTLIDSRPTDGYAEVVANSHYFGWYGPGANQLTLNRTGDPQAAPLVLTLPTAALPTGGGVLTDTAFYLAQQPANAGDTKAQPLYAVPLDGGPATVALADTGFPYPSADGGFVADSRSASGTVAAYRFDAAGDPPTLAYAYDDYAPVRAGLSLARGQLRFLETARTDGVLYADGYRSDSGTATAPTYGFPSRVGPRVFEAQLVHCADGSLCTPLADGGGSYGAAFVVHEADGQDAIGQVDAPVGTQTTVSMGSTGGRIVAAGTHDVLYRAPDGAQTVVDMSSHQAVRTVGAGASALWGDTLWSATATPGVLTSQDAGTGAHSASLTTDAPCVPDEIQVTGRFLYWSCGAAGPAGVYDTSAGRSSAVPAGPALLGDGYLVRQAGTSLLLTDVHSGQAAPERAIGALPAGDSPAQDGRNVAWTVDPFRGRVAYTDAQGATHVVAPGVTPSSLSLLPGSGAGGTLDVRGGGWQGHWQLSGPASSWSVTVRQVRTGSSIYVNDAVGGPTRDAISVTWDGFADFYPMEDGAYTWTLSAKPADGQGPALAVTGGFTVTNGTPAWRDYDGDGRPDLFGVPASSPTTLRMHPGAPGATFDGVVTTTGWPAGALVVPTGDLGGDGANDVLVRMASGEVRLYAGRATAPPSPAAGYRVVATGWQGYDAVIAVGRGEAGESYGFLARDTSGKLWRLQADSDGDMYPGRVYMSAGWGTYDLLIGARGMNRDSFSLLGRDSTGHLWIHQVSGDKVNAGRTELSAGWNTYTALVGVGDLDGDGRGEIAGRDATGELWLHESDGKGAVAQGRRALSGGWNYYAALA